MIGSFDIFLSIDLIVRSKNIFCNCFGLLYLALFLYFIFLSILSPFSMFSIDKISNPTGILDTTFCDKVCQ